MLQCIAIVTCENGHSWTTKINGTTKSVKEYFLGNYFETGVYPVEDMSKCIKCEVRELH